MLKTSNVNYIYFGRKNKFAKRNVNKKIKSKNCLSCRAYQNDKCILKYPIEIVASLPNGSVYHGPVIVCPKPLTWKELDKWLLKRKKKS